MATSGSRSLEISAALLKLQSQVAALPLPLLLNAYCADQRVVINKQGKPYTIDKRPPAKNPTSVLVALDKLILTKLRGSKDWKTV